MLYETDPRARFDLAWSSPISDEERHGLMLDLIEVASRRPYVTQLAGGASARLLWAAVLLESESLAAVVAGAEAFLEAER